MQNKNDTILRKAKIIDIRDEIAKTKNEIEKTKTKKRLKEMAEKYGK